MPPACRSIVAKASQCRPALRGFFVPAVPARNFYVCFWVKASLVVARIYCKSGGRERHGKKTTRRCATKCAPTTMATAHHTVPLTVLASLRAA